MTSDGVDKFMPKTNNQQHILDEFKNETHQGITNTLARHLVRVVKEVD